MTMKRKTYLACQSFHWLMSIRRHMIPEDKLVHRVWEYQGLLENDGGHNSNPAKS